MATSLRTTHSRLAELLAARGWTVAELERRLGETVSDIDRGTLQRLAGAAPIGQADVPTLRAICDALGVSIDELFRFAPGLPTGEPDELWEAPPERVRRADELAQKNGDGSISPDERRELAELVAEYEALAQHNARVRLWRREPERFDEAARRAG